MKTRLLLPFSILFFSLTAWSADVSLPITDDSTVTGNRASANYGTNTGITIHDFGPKQGLVRFDANGITGETVQSATLSLFLGSIRDSGLITIHPITSTWDEGSVTWNSLPSSEASAVASASVSSSNVGTVVTFDVTDTVQRWSSGLLESNGFLIVTSDVVRAIFDSKENSGGNPPTLNVVTDDVPPPPTPGVGTPPVVLDLSNPPVVIDQPGHYVLNQDWQIGGLPTSANVIDMQVNAILDMNGFHINVHHIGGAVVAIGSEGGTVINGRISMEGEGTTGIYGTGRALVRDINIRTAFDAFALNLNGAISEVSNVYIVSDNGIVIRGDYSSLIASNVGCDEPCLWLFANNVSIKGNTFGAPPGQSFWIQGDNNEFSQNTVDGYNGNGLTVEGNGNLIFGNTFKNIGGSVIEIDGSGNIIKDNIGLPNIPPNEPAIPAYVGILFLQDGNFYQNNLMNAVVPFELNGTTQTDLGGNAGY